MFSFSKIALFFTLGAAAFSAAAPVLNDVNVKHNDVQIRCDSCDSNGGVQVSLDVVIDTLVKTVTPICDELKGHNADTITLEIVEKKTAELTVALGVAIKGVKALVGAKIDVVLGAKLDISVCIKALVSVVVLLFQTLGFLLDICIKIKVELCKPLLVAVGKLVIELLVCVLDLVKTLDGLVGLVLSLLISLLGAIFHIVVKLGLNVQLGACLGISIN